MGGRTIAEAKERVSITEYRDWVLYRQKYGSLNGMMRTEWAAGLISSVLANVNRGKDSPSFKVTDFTPHINEPSISLEQAMQEWK
ncbi:phage tail assembly protein T [Escherichia coli]|uniref:phage tail assembly protein T n=1 Tax=Escherichia coli TaxID=562 RepID=UPI003F7ABED2